MKSYSIFALILLVVAIFVVSADDSIGNYPPAGIYIGVGSSFSSSVGDNFSQYVVNEIENFNYPDINGNHYSFSNFKVSISLNQFYYIQNAYSSYSVGWNDVQYKIQWNYHVCAGGIFNPCEDGVVTVFTTGQGLVSVLTTLSLSFNTSTTTLSDVSSQMNFQQGAVTVNVQCTNAVCIIPVSDIANQVAQSFVPSVTNGITGAVNKFIPNYLSLLDPIRTIPFSFKGDTYMVDMEGVLVQSGTDMSDTPTMTVASNGGIITKTASGSYIYPPGSPAFQPTNTQLESFTSDFCLTLTPFFFESLTNAAFGSIFPMTITPSEVPAASPVKLNTSDGFFTQVAPGLTQYPNLGIQVNLNSEANSIAYINDMGLYLNGTQLSADFIVLSDNPFTAFTVLFTVDALLNNEVNIISPQSISLASDLVSMNPNATITSSVIGSVDPTGFVQLLQMFESVIQIPSFNYTIPDKYTLESASLAYDNSIVQVFLDAGENLYVESKPTVPRIRFN
eukprot:gene2818-3503_t